MPLVCEEIIFFSFVKINRKIFSITCQKMEQVSLKQRQLSPLIALNYLKDKKNCICLRVYLSKVWQTGQIRQLYRLYVSV